MAKTHSARLVKREADTAMSAGISETLYQQYLAFLLSGQRVECTRIVKELLSKQVPVRRLHVDLFQASMYEVGEMWAVNRISVATEHVASAITEGLLNIVFSSVSYQPRTGRKAIVAGIQPELHQLGSRIVADTLEICGWDSLYVGSNTPTGELLRMIHETRPDLVAISLTVYFNLCALQEAIEQIRREFPEQRIVVGGQGVSQGISWLDEASPQVTHLGTLDELDGFLARFN